MTAARGRPDPKEIAVVKRDDGQFARIETILGSSDKLTFDECVKKFYDQLKAALCLPCSVTGIEDFDWEEYYVFGPGDREEYTHLCKTRPSYRDVFELLAIETNAKSGWMMHTEDIAARVRRKSDGKKFHLGLSEIKVVDKKSRNYQLIDDYAVWFVNGR